MRSWWEDAFDKNWDPQIIGDDHIERLLGKDGKIRRFIDWVLRQACKYRDNPCPICNGSGELPSPYHREITAKDKGEIAKILKEKGYSIRQIMLFLKYKSPRSITRLLEVKDE